MIDLDLELFAEAESASDDDSDEYRLFFLGLEDPLSEFSLETDSESDSDRVSVLADLLRLLRPFPTFFFDFLSSSSLTLLLSASLAIRILSANPTPAFVLNSSGVSTLGSSLAKLLVASCLLRLGRGTYGRGLEHSYV